MNMKRAAKMLMKNELGVVIVEQKYLQEVCGKLIPSINNVSTALLKWSYTESNYTFPDVFSAWADLDAGFTQLLQEYLEECSRYRKCFKDIIAETKKVTDVHKEKDRTASKVAASSSKLDNTRKNAKKNENNEKFKTQLSNQEADLLKAKAKDEETEELLRTTLADFELNKASVLKESLRSHCHALMDLLKKGMSLCKVKLEIAESMPDEPATVPDAAPDNNRKVEAIFSEFHLQLPPRDPALERNLPAQRFKSLPPPQPNCPPKSPRITTHRSVPVMPVHTAKSVSYPKPLGNIPDVDSDDEKDDDDYMIPSEDIVQRSSPKTSPPNLPPRIAEEEEEYVVPTLSPKSPMRNEQSPPPTETEAEYFEVVSDDEGSDQPLSNWRTSSTQRRAPEDAAVSEPVYTVPPDEDDESSDDNQLYRNMSSEELQQHQRTYVVSPVKPLPYGKTRKPAVFPKPAPKAKKDTPAPRRTDSASQDEQVAAEEDDIYSLGNLSHVVW